tara:strand:+ start:18 stop:1103 length:1086 start_codon:yes stop_codon:yes gene_type:complete
MAKKDTFTMEGVDAIDLSESTDNTEGAEVSTPEESTAGEGEGIANFVDAFSDALDGGDAKAKEPEAAEATEVADDDPKSSRSSADFKKIKEDRDAAKKELDGLRAKLAELENSDVDERMSDLTSERDDLSERLKLAAIERHPKFQQEFEAKVNSVTEQAKRIVGDHNAERVAELLGMADSEHRSNGIEELMMELSTTKQAQLGGLLTRVDEVRFERESALNNADETYKQIISDQQAQRDTAVAESGKMFDSVAAEATNLEVFAQRDDDSDWNSEVKQRVDMARAIFSGDNDPKELARASLWAAAGPKYRELLASQIELNRRLRKQLGDSGSANPSLSASGGGSGAATSKSFAEAYVDAMGG